MGRKRWCHREKSTFLSSRVVRRANFMLWQKRMVLHTTHKKHSHPSQWETAKERKTAKKNSKIPFKWEVRSRNPFAHIVVVLRPLPPLKFTHSHPSHTTSPVLSAFLNYTSMSLARSYNDVKARSILPCVKIILKAQLDVISLWDEKIFRMFSALYCHATKTHSSSSHTKRTLVRREREKFCTISTNIHSSSIKCMCRVAGVVNHNNCSTDTREWILYFLI